MPETSFTSFILGKYRAVELLGKGGFGTVYRAIDTTLDREVALKVLHPQLVADPTFVERFRTEAKIIAALRHPNVVGVYELGEEAGRLFIAMEYMPGGTLKDRLAQRERLSFDETLIIMQQVCAGLDAAHAEGMLHRDIKPGNILFDKRGHAVVGDFGLARAMQLSSIASASSSSGGVGTPFYKAPELWRGKPPASPATDVYALACTVYEMLTGRVLFGGDTPDEVLTKHLIDGPDFGTGWQPADAPEGLAEVIQRGLARNPEERYASAKALADALLSLRAQPQKSVEVTIPAIGVVAPAKQPMQPTPNNRSKLPILGIVMAAATAILLIGAMLGQAGNGNSPAAVAPTQNIAAPSAVEKLPNDTPTTESTSTKTSTPKPSDTPIDSPQLSRTSTFAVTPKPSNTPSPLPAAIAGTTADTPTPTKTKIPASIVSPRSSSTPIPSQATSNGPTITGASITGGDRVRAYILFSYTGKIDPKAGYYIYAYWTAGWFTGYGGSHQFDPNTSTASGSVGGVAPDCKVI